MNFSKLDEYLASLEEKYDVPSYQCAVAYKGEIVHSVAGGHVDGERKVPASRDDLYWLYSATKLSTMVAVMQQIEEGRLTLETELADIIPEYRNLRVRTERGFTFARKPITVRDLMTMTAGLTYDTAPCISYANRNPNATTVEIIKDYATAPLAFEPGSSYLYSMCHDVLAAVVEIVSGERFADYVKRRVLLPAGCKVTDHYVTDEMRSRIVSQYIYDMKLGKSNLRDGNCRFRFTENYDSGGAGLCGKAEDYVLLAAALANGGEINGNRILTPHSIDELRAYPVEGKARVEFARWHNRPGYNYSLGVRVLTNKDASTSLFPEGEFGWDGAAGALITASPETGIAFCYTMHIVGCGTGYFKIHPEIRNLVYKSIME
ncbi:MAG: beta-lactamase family protein [Ruminococcaceae bacterium]|nr:beta-lactamase family protein [Oscillospiraceae bacterium]